MTSTSPDYGHLYEAPYQVNDVVNFNEGNVSIVVVPEKVNGASKQAGLWVTKVER